MGFLDQNKDKPGSASDEDNKAASQAGDSTATTITTGSELKPGTVEPKAEDTGAVGESINTAQASDAAAQTSDGTGAGRADNAGLQSFFTDVDKDDLKSTTSLKRPGKDVPKTEADVDELKPIAAYKHRAVRHFKVGPFEFRNHILELYSEDQHNAFLYLYNGLEPRDQAEIVEYDFEAAARVERPVNVARGSLGTDSIKDPKVVK